MTVEQLAERLYGITLLEAKKHLPTFRKHVLWDEAFLQDLQREWRALGAAARACWIALAIEVAHSCVVLSSDTELAIDVKRIDGLKG